MALEFNPAEGKTTYEILEYPIMGSSSAALYDPNGIEFSYGYAEHKSIAVDDGDNEPGYKDVYKNYNYGALDSSSVAFNFGGIEYSPGLHGITLSRSLEPGEKITIKWKNGYELVIYGELINWNAENVPYTRMKVITGGSYQETGKWGETQYKYSAVKSPKNEYLYLYYEYVNGTYQKTEDTKINKEKTYYTKSEIYSEHVIPRFNDDIYTKRFDYIETINFKELE